MYNMQGGSQQPPQNYQAQQHRSYQAIPQMMTHQPVISTNPEPLNKDQMQERIKSILPPPMLLDTLKDMGMMSVPQLCQLGREIVQDITIRAMNVLSFFKMGTNRRNNPALDIEAILVYSKYLFQKLEEIRIRVDKARKSCKCKPIKEEDFFSQITNPEPVEEETQSSTKHALIEQLEGNRTKIIEMSNKIKKLEWYSSVIDIHN